MIIRTDHKTDFTQLPNAIARNEELNCEAFGMLAYLLTKPRDWNVNVRQLMRWSGFGEKKVRRILNVLITAGYVLREQAKDGTSKQFQSNDYWVFDVPQLGNEKPGGSFGRAALCDLETAQETTAEISQVEPLGHFRPDGFGRHTKEYNTNLPTEGENSAPNGAGDKPPFKKLSDQIWRELPDLLAIQNPNSKQCRSLIGQWQKRTPSIEAKDKLLAIAAAARGTPEPISYISAAMNDAFPKRADPKEHKRPRWEFLANRAIEKIHEARKYGKTPDLAKIWDNASGPMPGKPKCLLPKDLQARVLAALSGKQEIAA